MTVRDALPRVKALYMALSNLMSSEDIEPLGVVISALQELIEED